MPDSLASPGPVRPDPPAQPTASPDKINTAGEEAQTRDVQTGKATLPKPPAIPDQAAPEPPQEATTGPVKPLPPEAGSRLRFMDSEWYIAANAPDRAGLPVVFALCNAAGLARRGTFDLCLNLLREKVGEFGPWTVETPEPVAFEPSRPDQRPGVGPRPAVRRSHVNRRGR